MGRISDTYPEDESAGLELDRLVRRALKALVSEQDPPEHVWKRIKVALERNQSPPRHFRTPWVPLVLQPALTLLLVMLGGVGLRMLLNPDDIQHSFSDPSRPVAMVYVGEQSISEAPAMFDDKAELRSLKTLSIPRYPRDAGGPAYPAPPQARGGRVLAYQANAEPADQPALVVPRDPTPNVLSPEGRALLAKLSAEYFAVEESTRLHSGPYQWSR